MRGAGTNWEGTHLRLGDSHGFGTIGVRLGQYAVPAEVVLAATGQREHLPSPKLKLGPRTPPRAQVLLGLPALVPAMPKGPLRHARWRCPEPPCAAPYSYRGGVASTRRGLRRRSPTLPNTGGSCHNRHCLRHRHRHRHRHTATAAAAAAAASTTTTTVTVTGNDPLGSTGWAFTCSDGRQGLFHDQIPIRLGGCAAISPVGCMHAGGGA